MKPEQLTILLIEDNPGDALLIRTALAGPSQPRFVLEWADRLSEALAKLSSQEFELVLLDLNLPDSQGLETFLKVSVEAPKVPIIVLTGLDDEDLALGAVRAGAQDYLIKGEVSHSTMVRSFMYAVERNNAITERLNQELALAAGPRYGMEPSLAAGDSWSDTLDRLVARLADSNAPILIQGETGVGKEVLARKIHVNSPRAGKPFLKVNCAALPSELIESELFGFERGAFTGAFQKTIGKFELANNGTILLDEIGDMDFKLQSKLLHVLQDGAFTRLGCKEETRVNFRLMAATHCDLERLIEDSKFRQDLYYRLNVVNIQIPPLRERKNEILLLVEHFLEKYEPDPKLRPAVTPVLHQALMCHDWPGNIRELENVIRKLITFKDPAFVAADLRRRMRPEDSAPAGRAEQAPAPPPSARTNGVIAASAPSSPAQPGTTSQPTPVTADINSPYRAASKGFGKDPKEEDRTAESEAILKALQSTLWNRRKAAAVLQMDYKVMLYRMKKLGIAQYQAKGALQSASAAPAYLQSAASRDTLSENGTAAAPTRPVSLSPESAPGHQVGAEAILNALNSTFWNRRKAAALLNLDYKVLLYRMKRLGIGQTDDDPTEDKPEKAAAAAVGI